MKVRERWHYDEAYDKGIAEWEDFLRNSRLSSKRTTWYFNLLMGLNHYLW